MGWRWGTPPPPPPRVKRHTCENIISHRTTYPAGKRFLGPATEICKPFKGVSVRQRPTFLNCCGVSRGGGGGGTSASYRHAFRVFTHAVSIESGATNLVTMVSVGACIACGHGQFFPNFKNFTRSKVPKPKRVLGHSEQLWFLDSIQMRQ